VPDDLGKANKDAAATQRDLDDSEREQVYAAFARARQNVKPLVKRLSDAERVDEELFFMRLRKD
jgi:hypothetical protein